MSFFPVIINDYINQLESLKRDGKENLYLLDKLIIEFKNCKLELNDNVDLANSWLLNCIGWWYYDKEKEYPEAIEWYMKSINLGNSEAMCNLGYYYDEIEKDYPKAIEWYTKSANLGNSDAMNCLGYYYDEIEKDYPKAIEWYTKSINLGNNTAMFNLGYYYQYIEKDYHKAIELYIKSANLDNSNVIRNLKIIKIKEIDYDYIYKLLSIHDENKEIKNILLDKLSKEYIYTKKEEENNYLKSIKNQGIDKVLINSIFKHF